MPRDAPMLTRIDGVELIRTGQWRISTGEWDVSTQDLAAAVAALDCPAIRKPVLKLGHVDPRFDGEPAVGRVDNLRLADGGHTLVGDYTGVPGWLGQVAASAYPDRSVEGTYSFRCQIGHNHPFVLTAVALLGVTAPGVGTLQSLKDVAALYGVAAAAEPDNGVLVRATVGGEVRQPDAPTVTAPAVLDATVVQIVHQHVHAAGVDRDRLHRYWTQDPEGLAKWRTKPHPWTALYRHLKKHMPDEMAKRVASDWFHDVFGYYPGDRRHRKKVAAAGGTDWPDEGDTMPNPQPSVAERIRAAWNDTAPHSRWVVEVNEAAGEVIVIDDADRSLHRVPVTVTASGVTFGQAVPVRMAYVPADGQPVAASRVVFASREESRPDVPDEPPPANEDAPPTPPDQGGVPVSPAAEPVPNTNTEREDPVSTLSDAMRSRLGLPADATDEQIVAAFEAASKPKPNEPTPTPAEPATPSGPATPSEPTPSEPARAPELVAAAAAVQEYRTELDRVSAELAEIKAREAATVKASVFDGAVREGRIMPAERPTWEARYDKAPDIITDVLASIAPGTAVPVMASGHTGTGEEQVSIDDEYERLTALLDGPTATSKGA